MAESEAVVLILDVLHKPTGIVDKELELAERKSSETLRHGVVDVGIGEHHVAIGQVVAVAPLACRDGLGETEFEFREGIRIGL